MAINWDEEDSTEEQELPADVIKSVQLQIQANNEHVLINSEHRNVLMVGRTRSGKSTTLEVLKDPCYTPPNDTIFSETVDSKCWSFALKRRSQDGRTVDYSLNLIDTPGLFEVKGGQSGEERTNEVIKNTISQCLENEITHIHAIIMFVTFEAGINQEDVQAGVSHASETAPTHLRRRRSSPVDFFARSSVHDGSPDHRSGEIHVPIEPIGGVH